MWRKTETDNYQLLTIKHLSSIWAHSLCVYVGVFCVYVCVYVCLPVFLSDVSLSPLFFPQMNRTHMLALHLYEAFHRQDTAVSNS